MANAGSNTTMKILMIAIGIPVTQATRKLVDRTWQAARPDASVRDPQHPEVHWADAIAWAALSAVGLVAAELATRFLAETTYRTVLGIEPPTIVPKRQSRAVRRRMRGQGMRSRVLDATLVATGGDVAE
jgi:hypothetical protein